MSCAGRGTGPDAGQFVVGAPVAVGFAGPAGADDVDGLAERAAGLPGGAAGTAHPGDPVGECSLAEAELEAAAAEHVVFATGLRNPQELAFDEFGNLFTGDNNSDSGDKARWVYVVEGGDSGWRIGYQFIAGPDSRGPWNEEKLWHPAFDGQAAYIVPPIANIADGPSGLAYDPGVSLLPEAFRRHFFLVDFRGASGQSGIRSFALRPKGASFELVDSKQFVWSTLATDVDFGPDGALYFCDWVEGWEKPNKGRIYRVLDPSRTRRSAGSRKSRRCWPRGWTHRPNDELARLLAHPDMRVRQEAQFALAARGEVWLAASAKGRRGDRRSRSRDDPE